MSKEKIPVAIYGGDETYLEIGDFKIPCYVLDNGQRVLSQSGMIKALGISYNSATGKYVGLNSPARLARFAGGKRISQFVSNDLRGLLENPLKFKIPTSGTDAYGYEATVLVDICNSIIEARKASVLQKQQEKIADRAQTLIQAFAKTGIIALVDEATGYQKDVNRAKDELKQILAKFLLKEHAKWLKTFPDEFFEMIFKMKDWTWVGISKSKKPQVLGHYINDLVYARLAPKILDELRDKNPVLPSGARKVKHHQYLTPDFGNPKLKEHLVGILALGRASGYNWRVFQKMVDKSYPKFGETLQILFPDDDVFELPKNSGTKPSTFDSTLRGLLSVPPPKGEPKKDEKADNDDEDN